MLIAVGKNVSCGRKRTACVRKNGKGIPPRLSATLVTSAKEKEVSNWGIAEKDVLLHADSFVGCQFEDNDRRS